MARPSALDREMSVRPVPPELSGYGTLPGAKMALYEEGSHGDAVRDSQELRGQG